MSNVNIPLRVHGIAQLEAYQVTAEELSAIKREGSNVGLDFSAMQFFLTIAISFLIALLTTTIQSERVFEVFVVLVTVGFFLGVIFGIKWFLNRGSVNAIFQRIEARQIGPTGEEGRELSPAQVAQLPQVTAPLQATISAAAHVEATATTTKAGE